MERNTEMSMSKADSFLITSLPKVLEEQIAGGKTRKRYDTLILWISKDYSSLHKQENSQGVLSIFFWVNGIEEGLCQLVVDLEDPRYPLNIEFPYSLRVSTMNVFITINSEKFEFCYQNPFPRTVKLLGITESSRNAKLLNDVLKSSFDDKKQNPMNFQLRFEITKLPESDVVACKKPIINVVENMKTMFYDKAFCDITFVVGDKELPAHKAIVVVQSKVFEAMLSNPMKEKETSRVEIVDTEAEIFEEFLKFLYIGEVNNLQPMVEQMLNLAEKYEVGDLKDLCESCMLKNISEENVVKYLLIADKISCTALKTRAIAILKKSGSALTRAITEGNMETLIRLKEMLSNDSSDKE